MQKLKMHDEVPVQWARHELGLGARFNFRCRRVALIFKPSGEKDRTYLFVAMLL